MPEHHNRCFLELFNIGDTVDKLLTTTVQDENAIARHEDHNAAQMQGLAKDIVGGTVKAVDIQEQPPPIMVQAHAPKEFVKPIDKISQKAFDSQDRLYQNNTQLAMEKSGCSSAITVFVRFVMEKKKFDGLEHPFLTAWERAVYEAVIALYLAGNEYISFTMVYRALTGKKSVNPSPVILQQIGDALQRLICTYIEIDASQEQKPYHEARPFKYHGHLLEANYVTDEVKINGSRVINGGVLHVFELPALFQFASRKRQITRGPMNVLDVPVNHNRAHIILRDYLLRRIYGPCCKGKINTISILYDSLYAVLKVDPGNRESKNKRLRLRTATLSILNSFQSDGIIRSYHEEMKDGGAVPKNRRPFRIIVKRSAALVKAKKK